MKRHVHSVTGKRCSAPAKGKRRSFALIAGGMTLATLFVTLTWLGAKPTSDDHGNESGDQNGVLHARILATGIPGAGAVAEIGDFLRGSPMHDKAAFTVFAQPGHVLDPKRVLVARERGKLSPSIRTF